MKVTMRDKRVGKMLAAAVYATSRLISITEVALQAADQGLMPADFDRENGTDALIAIAQSMTGKKTPASHLRREPATWRPAVDAALKIVSSRETPRQRRAAHWRVTVRAEQHARRSTTDE